MNNKKKVFVTAVAVCLIAILSFSTLAWFNAQDDLTNKFHVATSNDPTDPEGIFSVDLKESNDPEDDGNEYLNITPNATYRKDPTVYNTGRYNQFIRVIVEVSDAKAWLDMMPAYEITDLATIFEGHAENEWSRYDAPVYSSADDTLTYVYYLNYTLAPSHSAQLFSHVHIPEVFTQDDLAKLNGGFEINIVAEALQSDNTGYDNAYDAFQNLWEN